MLNNKVSLVIIFAFIVSLGVFFIFAIPDEQNPDRDYRSAFQRHYKILTPKIPDNMDFAGENVPLEIFYVRESLDREIMACTFMHSSTNLMFKRAYRYFPVIEPILKKNNIPEDFKYLALAESNLGNVTSPSGAEGMWQFLLLTGRKYGLEINAEIDERYHLEKATEAACHYLADAYTKFGSWTLAAASYNRGMEGLSRALEHQGVSSYYDLFLNEETARYLFRVLAAKEVYNHPTKYGFYLKETDFYPSIQTYTITVDTTIQNLPEFALRIKCNYRILRELNPWIHSYSLPNKSGKTYEIKLPKEGFTQLYQEHQTIKSSETFFHDTLKINEIH